MHVGLSQSHHLAGKQGLVAPGRETWDSGFFFSFSFLNRGEILMPHVDLVEACGSRAPRALTLLQVTAPLVPEHCHPPQTLCPLTVTPLSVPSPRQPPVCVCLCPSVPLSLWSLVTRRGSLSTRGPWPVSPWAGGGPVGWLCGGPGLTFLWGFSLGGRGQLSRLTLGALEAGACGGRVGTARSPVLLRGLGRR